MAELLKIPAIAAAYCDNSQHSKIWSFTYFADNRYLKTRKGSFITYFDINIYAQKKVP